MGGNGTMLGGNGTLLNVNLAGRLTWGGTIVHVMIAPTVETSNRVAAAPGNNH